MSRSLIVCCLNAIHTLNLQELSFEEKTNFPLGIWNRLFTLHVLPMACSKLLQRKHTNETPNWTEGNASVCKNTAFILLRTIDIFLTLSCCHYLNAFSSLYFIYSGIQATWNYGWRFFSAPTKDAWMWTLKSNLQGNFLLWSFDTQCNAY